MARSLSHYTWALQWRWRLWRNNQRWKQAALAVARHSPSTGARPVVFFNASTRLIGMSQNAGFSLLAAWGLRLRGVPVIHAVCQAGMSCCVLGTNRDHPQSAPPCAGCIKQSTAVYAGADTRSITYQLDPKLEEILGELSVPQMVELTFQSAPLGALALPSLRWILRRHHISDDENTRTLFRQYILSTWSIIQAFGTLLDSDRPQALVVFNGISYPEAAARWAAQKRGIPVVTHEVAHAPYTAFFSHGEATAYPIDIPQDFKLNPEQNTRLDAYLEQRFQGNFSMAGIRFWPEMRSLGDAFWQRVSQCKQIVPVFTNVIFDTSQAHANVAFEHMFAWLDQVLEIAQAHPETLFVIRAHPDETRPGKESLESVADWVNKHGVSDLENVLFVPSDQFFSSYELIQRSKFVMVYNSTIGLEAVLLGAPVLSAGKSRYTQLPMVFFPQTAEAHREVADEFLSAETIHVPAEHKENARRFLHFQLYRVALPFGALLEEDHIWRGYVRLKDFSVEKLMAPTFGIIAQGITNHQPFVMEGQANE